MAALTFSGVLTRLTEWVLVVLAALVALVALALTAIAATAARAAEPLELTLESSRDVCTANTQTELSWTISGGQPPYTLSIDGEPVDPESGSLRVNCGPLPVDLEGNTLSTGTKTFSASVTDSYSDPQTETASVELDLAEPLPAPSWIGHYHFGDASVAVAWPEVAYDADETRRPLYLIRYRAVGALDWTYEPAGGAETSLRPAIGAHEVSVAAQRHFLEDESPDALSWSTLHTFARVVAPANVTAAATHDTVTVSWDGQPYGAARGWVRITASNGRLVKRFERPDTDGRQSVTFEHVLPDTTFRVEVQMEVTESDVGLSVTEVTTEPAPSDWTPLPTGPANLSVTATASSITVEWDLPHPDVPKAFWAIIQGAETGVVVANTWSKGDPGEWTTRGDYHWIKPATTYRVTVVHFALPRASEEVTITTPASDPPVPAANRQPSTEILGNEALGVAAFAAASERPPFALRWPIKVDTEHARTDDTLQGRTTNADDQTGLDIVWRRNTPGASRQLLLAPASSRVLGTTDMLTELSWTTCAAAGGTSIHQLGGTSC